MRPVDRGGEGHQIGRRTTMQESVILLPTGEILQSFRTVYFGVSECCCSSNCDGGGTKRLSPFEIAKLGSLQHTLSIFNSNLKKDDVVSRIQPIVQYALKILAEVIFYLRYENN